MRRQLMKIPGLQLPFHAPVLFLHIPDVCVEGTVFLLCLIDEAFEIVVFIPDDVLGCFITIEIDARLKYIVIGVYLFP